VSDENLLAKLQSALLQICS